MHKGLHEFPLFNCVSEQSACLKWYFVSDCLLLAGFVLVKVPIYVAAALVAALSLLKLRHVDLVK
jgi:hypothetical protein